jgi:hypothetical protein
MERDLNAIPATMGDVVQLLATVLAEVMEHGGAGASANTSLIELANNLDALGKNTTNARARLLLVALAQRLKTSEEGA